MHAFGLSLSLAGLSLPKIFYRLKLEFPKWIDFFKKIKAVQKRRKLLNKLSWFLIKGR